MGHPVLLGDVTIGQYTREKKQDGGVKPPLQVNGQGAQRVVPLRRGTREGRATSGAWRRCWLGAATGGRGDEEIVGGVGVEEGLAAIEESGVVGGTVVVDLAPVLIEEAEDAGGAEGQVECGGSGFEAAAFTADGVENFSRDVQRIMMEFNGNASAAGEEAFVNAADFGPATLDATDGIVHGNVVERGPILAHEDDVSGVKGTIELSESVTRMSEIAKIFETGDGIERGGKCW